MSRLVRLLKRLVEAVTKPYFFKIVSHAYAQSGCPEHKKIMAWGRTWYGIERASPITRLVSRWSIDFVAQALIDLFHSEMPPASDLGFSPIGVQDLQIHCLATDINSSLVYLLGFSDNLTCFDLYSVFAKPGSAAVDVGANLGMHSIVLSSIVGSEGRVYAFEPLKPIRDRLLDNLDINRAGNVLVTGKGVGSKIGKMMFDSHDQDFNIGKGRISNEGDTEIDITTLDDELSDCTTDISLVKIDVEEHEMEVVRGAAKLLTVHQPVIFTEFNADSYSLEEFKKNIPFEAYYFRVPLSYYEKLEPLSDTISSNCDVVVVPKVKLTEDMPTPWDSMGSKSLRDVAQPRDR